MSVQFVGRLFFEYGQYGWGESYYGQAADMSQAKQNLKRLGKARGDLVFPPVTIVCATASNLDIKGDSQLAVDAGWQNKALNRANPDFVCTSAFCRLAGDAGKYHRQLTLRALKDDYFEDNVLPTMGMKKEMADKLAEYIKFLVDEMWCIRCYSKEAAEGPHLITDITKNLNGTIDLKVVGHGLGKPTLIKVENTGVKREFRKTVTGVHPVIPTTADILTIATPWPEGYRYNGTAQYYVRKQILVPITSGEFLRYSNRQTGRSQAFLPRGRSRNRATT